MEMPDRRVSGPAFNDSPHLMAVLAFDGTFRVVNAAWERVLGYRPDELVGHTMLRFIDDADRALLRKLMNLRVELEGDRRIELTLKARDGSYRSFEWERRRVAGEPSVFILGRDVTDRRKLEVTQTLKLYELQAAAARQKKEG